MSTAPPGVIVLTTLPRDPRLLLRDHNQIMNTTLRDAAKMHHEQHIPRHFQDFAAAKYGYLKRGSKYQARKDRLGLPPLISPNPKTTGELRTAMVGFRKITSTATRARLIMALPFRGGTGRLIKRGTKLTDHQKQILARIAEMEAISSDEQSAINAFIGHGYAMLTNRPGQRYRMRTR